MPELHIVTAPVAREQPLRVGRECGATCGPSAATGRSTAFASHALIHFTAWAQSGKHTGHDCDDSQRPAEAVSLSHVQQILHSEG